ncbi:MAG: guanylate kinase [Bacteroidales bacterium]|nr:guanylate kinase [Bacteroidales bacterium]
MTGKIIIFSAPSGSGKTTIVHHLLKAMPELAFSVSATSRKPRKNEKQGVDYYFLTPEDFKKRVLEGAFLEWEEVYDGQFYGTLRSEVEQLRMKGKHIVFDIDVKGGMNLKKEFGDDALAIFVKSPGLDVMEERLRKRGTDSGNQLKKRISKAVSEISYADQFDRILVNEDLQDSLKKAENLVKEFINFTS